MNNYCVIAAVGRQSLHRKWLSNFTKFDLHLIVYDDSYRSFKSDSPYITQSIGYKFNLIYTYLTTKPDLLDQYEYFYMPDDDVLIDGSNIQKLFEYMERFGLDLAQPAISNNYYSYRHLFKQPKSKLRFTNFVEVMQPCFSRNALKKVLFTFNESVSGWGIDFHWGILLDYTKMNIAVIDDVTSIHTKPVQSSFHAELGEYLIKNNLKQFIYST